MFQISSINLLYALRASSIRIRIKTDMETFSHYMVLRPLRASSIRIRIKTGFVSDLRPVGLVRLLEHLPSE